MKIILQKSICALAIFAAGSTMVMANSIDVKIIGTIAPSACTPSLSGGGIIDYGMISASSLKKDTLTQLEKKNIDFSITCDAPTKMALRAINGRPSTAAGTTETGENGGRTPDSINKDYGDFVVGLGLDGQNKIGGYNIALQKVTLDGNYAEPIVKEPSDSTWQVPEYKIGNLYSEKQILTSFSLNNENYPSAFTTLSGSLGVQAYINKSSELNLTKPIKLNGLTTIELVYL